MGRFLVLVFFLQGWASFSEAKALFRGPVIRALTGKVELWGPRDQELKAKAQVLLKEKAKFVTQAQSWVAIELAPNEVLLVGPESEVVIPVIAMDDGAIERVEVMRGAARFTNLSSKGRTVVTPLTRDSYSEADFVLTVDLPNGRVRMSVIEGRVAFRGLENEELTSIPAGEEASFTGSREQGDLMFDVLIGGKRIARGQMGPVAKYTQAWLSEWQKGTANLSEAHRKQEIQKAKAAALKGGICKKPGGFLDQCVWRCLGNPRAEKTKCLVERAGVKCIRERCDNNGHWSDRMVLPAVRASCGALERVGPCDY